MKLPEKLDQITLNPLPQGHRSFPPPAFLPFSDYELGNGDEFGLYWPIGHESHTPLILETWHDTWEVVPYFSSLSAFLDATEGIEPGDRVDAPSLSQDPLSPLALYSAANASLMQDNPEQAVSYLEAAVNKLPEYTHALGMLASQYRRLRKYEAAVSTALRAIRSPPSFGQVNSQLMHWFARQTSADSIVVSDPLWLNRARLKLKFGGEKLNDDYVVLKEIIDAYIDGNLPIEAFTLSQMYAENMCRETVSFQERYNFSAESWLKQQLANWREMTGTSRDVREIVTNS